jgi:hypothetical protein
VVLAHLPEVGADASLVVAFAGVVAVDGARDVVGLDVDLGLFLGQALGGGASVVL